MKNVLKNRIIMKRLAVMAVALALVYFFGNTKRRYFASFGRWTGAVCVS